MPHEVVLSRRALLQLRAINRYIARIAYPDTADDFTDRVLDRCRRIANVPHGGTPRPELGRDLRSVSYDRRATIIYRVRGQQIIVAAILYGGQDAKRHLRR